MKTIATTPLALVKLFGVGNSQKIRYVQDLDFWVGFFEAGLDLEEAAGVGGDHDLGAGGEDVFDLSLLEARGYGARA